MSELIAIIIGVLSATVSCFLTAYLTYFFEIHRKKNEFKINAKKDLLDKIEICLKGIPYTFVTYGDLPFLKDEVSKKAEGNEIFIKDEVIVNLNTKIFLQSVKNSKGGIGADFCDEYKEMSDTWFLVLNLRNFMRTSKALASYYKKFELFFNENTELITPFMLAVKTDWVNEVKDELTEILRTIISESNFSEKQKTIMNFFTSIKQLYHTLNCIKEEVIGDITY